MEERIKWEQYFLDDGTEVLNPVEPAHEPPWLAFCLAPEPALTSQEPPAAKFQTDAEVAAALRITVRKLRELVRKHGVEALHVGRKWLFDKRALRSLKEVLRCAKEAPDSESLPVPTPARSQSSARSRAAAYDAALKATTVTLPVKKPRPSKPKSSAPPGTANVVALGPSRKR
jgi:excisionase family DNA binding protein